MKLLVLGAGGQVGTALQPVLASLGEVVAVGRAAANLANPDQLRAVIARERPDVIINAGAYTRVDDAESNAHTANTVNGEALHHIGEAAAAIGALVVHYSTDYVFDGKSGGFQSETQESNPLSVYGASKLRGDQLLAHSGADHLILRVSWVYSPTASTFPSTILRLAREREDLNVVDNEVGAATSAHLIAGATAQLIPLVLADRSKGGLYHFAPSGAASRHELARFIVSEALAAGGTYKIAPDGIRAIASFPAKAKRPANSRLDTAKLRSVFPLSLPSWQAGIREFIAILKTEGRL